MARKSVANVSKIAREGGLARSTLERVLSGETKSPSAKTVRVLQHAGLMPADAPLLLPSNVRSFGQELSLKEVEQLIRVRLKPVNRMSPQELRHIYESMKEFPEVYQWDGEAPTAEL